MALPLSIYAMLNELNLNNKDWGNEACAIVFPVFDFEEESYQILSYNLLVLI